MLTMILTIKTELDAFKYHVWNVHNILLLIMFVMFTTFSLNPLPNEPYQQWIIEAITTTVWTHQPISYLAIMIIIIIIPQSETTIVIYHPWKHCVITYLQSCNSIFNIIRLMWNHHHHNWNTVSSPICNLAIKSSSPQKEIINIIIFIIRNQ